MIVTVKLHVPALPCESVAVHCTTVVPYGNNEPEAGVHVTPIIFPHVLLAVAPEYVTFVRLLQLTIEIFVEQLTDTHPGTQHPESVISVRKPVTLGITFVT